MTVAVRRAGLSTTIQDAGRWGYQHLGVPVAGAMDHVSYRLVNALVGNPPTAAALEVTLTGPELEFDRPTWFAVTGAIFDLRLDGTVVPAHTSCRADAGQVLAFGERRAGARAYLGVAGGFDVPLVLGSRSTHVLSGIGGVAGRTLKSGDVLPVGDAGDRRPAKRKPRVDVVSLPKRGARVRVIVGPHADQWGDRQVREFTGGRYRVTPESDRMGYRLEGAPLETPSTWSPISSGVAVGSVQIPHGGCPIVLMADHQTTGGYPRIGTVITADLPLVGQLMASDWIEFEPTTRAEAVKALIRQERALMA